MAIYIDGKEVTNPLAKALLTIGAVLLSGAVVGLVFLFVLPVIGVALTLSAGLVLGILALVGVVLTAVLIGSAVLGVVIAPFAFLRNKLADRGRE